ncbi:Kelch repeat-containing protein [Dyadobacter frigoris]|uniref:IPT/TIG domain-containing protein n=1 Tax=Dyadobacter frigoris TaxID=2576211 RepID=A0A4U6DAG4_9BACT|nr:hypothetical protein [Dyadobacter frigoris]TKT93168.1 hypothetical protein FDK13_04755 [Dyadobacter frigoris]GLU54797.1 hypothetical protein Dfri01_42580 [Dyadobacter frigoris]
MHARHILFLGIILFSLSCKKKTEEQPPLPQAPPVAKLTFPTNKEGSTGTVLMIEGENFAEKPADNVIKVNGVQVSHVEVVELKPLTGNKTTRMLRTCIPKGAKSGEVTLTIGNNTIELGGLVIKEYTSDGKWKQVADFPGTPKTGLTSAFVINGKAYVGLGGKATTEEYTDTYFYDFWEYDPSLDKWTKKADFPGGNRNYFISFAIGNKGYLGLGSRDDVVGSLGDEFQKDFWEYDPAIDKWAKKKDFPGGRRTKAYCLSIGNHGYVGSGLNVAVEVQNDLWQYNPIDDSWKERAPFPYKEAFAYGLSIETPLMMSTPSKGYLMSSELADLWGIKYAFWQYDPLTDKWAQKSTFIGINSKNGVISATYDVMLTFGFSLGGQVYVPMLYYDNLSKTWYPQLFAYDEGAGNWTKKPDYTAPPQNNVTFSIGNNAYVGLGPFQKDLWKFTP